MTQKHHNNRNDHRNNSQKQKSHAQKLAKKLAKQLRPWHRRLGIFCALFIMLMASSGVVINHSNHLSIDTAQVQQKWMLDYYGITPPNNIAIYQTEPLSLASTDNLAWVQHQLAVEADSPIKGMLTLGNILLAIDNNHLYMLSKDGELMEKQDASMGLPRGIEAIGFDGQVWLKTQDGYFMADDELIEWTQAEPLAIIPWSQALSTPAAQSESGRISLLARSSHLTWERVILDIHSGRFFGSLGPWFMDLVALSLIIMAISGIYLWQQGKPKKKARGARSKT
ncbi:PepSY domain-containing protein [Shewanella eurypsychrophilus]|uniref:PepSY domain-containing protein n=1 Tax=Shewanella eurypsychrophilus TaxID=2593656 RepID=A0ABX6V542_9GAMM|nr:MULTISPECIES: PepSY-associated TM helix domain-containing protein [Shewanella]QFU21380.1 PepSY domain-containing protein [Shewanella sp. YLB-09]QPG56670.1 PepSY domain-containing protein [Shewanella eurypsychrophilus]